MGVTYDQFEELKEEVNNIKCNIKVVDVLPTTGCSNTIYFVRGASMYYYDNDVFVDALI